MKRRYTLFIITAVILLMILPATAMAADVATDGDSVAPVSGVVQVIKDYLPLLSVVFFFLGQALKTIPGFRAWLLPFIMGLLGLAFGLVIGLLTGGDALFVILAAVEGLVAGLASTGINEAKKQAIGNQDAS